MILTVCLQNVLLKIGKIPIPSKTHKIGNGLITDKGRQANLARIYKNILYPVQPYKCTVLDLLENSADSDQLAYDDVKLTISST